MARGPNFIDRAVFEDIMRAMKTARGLDYQDINTIYGDMSRLVVVFLATTPPDQLVSMYNELSWEGSANGRALHEAAKKWLLTYHPERAARLGISEANDTM